MRRIARALDTRCTRWRCTCTILHEVKKTDVVDVSVRILGTDRKRIHAAFDMTARRYADPVATAEMMLLHVHQGESRRPQAFPPEVVEALARVSGAKAGPARPGGIGAGRGRWSRRSRRGGAQAAASRVRAAWNCVAAS